MVCSFNFSFIYPDHSPLCRRHRSSALKNTRGTTCSASSSSSPSFFLLFSSETCIKGHRSSACKHTDRPLFEIKKKGRPVTQCEHCRELRKTKQVHVKCLCESKAESSSSHHQQGVLLHFSLLVYGRLMDKIIFHAFCCLGPKLGFESAAFPNGLPQALEASVAFQSLAEGTSSDSDHGGMQLLPRRHLLCSAAMLILH